MSGVDHDYVWLFDATRHAAKEAIKNALSCPTDKAIAQGLVRPLNFGCVSPSQTVSDDAGDSAYDTPVIDTGSSVGLPEAWFDALKLRLGQPIAIRNGQVLLPT